MHQQHNVKTDGCENLYIFTVKKFVYLNLWNSIVQVLPTYVMFFCYRSVDHIWDHVQDKHTHVALVFEEEESYIGRKVSNHEVLFT